MDSVLSVSHLTVVAAASGAPLVESVDLSVARGETVGVVGESGSGKTTLGLACLGYARSGTKIVGGTVRLAGTESSAWTRRDLLALRRRHIAYVPQSAGFALDPALHIEVHLRARLAGAGLPVTEERLLDALEDVALPRRRDFLRRYPHELSGGQQQRVVLAAAFIAEPAVIILDEPTTGLDVATQAQILALVRRICDERQAAAIFISHNLGAVAELSTRAAVMYAGRIVETGPTADLLARPRHPYTRGLLAAVPQLRGRRAISGIAGRMPAPGQRLRGCTFAARCGAVEAVCREQEPGLVTAGPRSVRCHFARMDDLAPLSDRPARHARDATGSAPAAPLSLGVANLNVHYGPVQVLHDVNLVFPAGRCTALVGESGSGKTTLCRAIIGLHSHYTGVIRLENELLAARVRRRSPQQRRVLQYIFQSPYDSLNPRRTVHDLIVQPAKFFGEPVSPDYVRQQLALVSLGPELANRYPHQLSGGERQRVALARALAVHPRILICDEVTSALDVSVQASIVGLIKQLCREMNLTVIFVTHDIALVRQLAEAVVVLKNGHVVEEGPVERVFNHPAARYTQSLIDNTPDLWRLVSEREMSQQTSL